MLEEAGQSYRTEILDYATTLKAPAYLAINPIRGALLRANEIDDQLAAKMQAAAPGR